MGRYTTLEDMLRTEGMSLLSLQSGIIYGPIQSRRLGASLGINLMPTQYKLCPFNCVYCQYGWTNAITVNSLPYQNDLPTPDQVETALKKVLMAGTIADYITFSGNGEATIHPNFDEIVERVAFTRDKYLPQARTCILSNSAVVNREDIRSALEKLDVRIMKLDAGDEETFFQINRPTIEVKFKEIIAGLKKLSYFTMQSLFVTGEVSNIEETKVANWIAHVDQLRPREVQIYSIDRMPAYAKLTRVGLEKLNQIADLGQRMTGVAIKVYLAKKHE